MPGSKSRIGLCMRCGEVRKLKGWVCYGCQGKRRCTVCREMLPEGLSYRCMRCRDLTVGQVRSGRGCYVAAPDIEERIAYYRDRAELELPLFTESPYAQSDVA